MIDFSVFSYLVRNKTIIILLIFFNDHDFSVHDYEMIGLLLIF